MRDLDQRPLSFGDIGIRFVILVLAALILMALQLSGRLTPIQSFITQLTSPTQLVTTGVVGSARNWVSFISELGSIRTNNVELRRINEALLADIVRLEAVERENERLRLLLEFDSTRPDIELRGAQIVARVLGQDSSNFQNFILLDLGTVHGIQIGMPVVTDVGLVGRITEVTNTTSKVLLVTDPNSGVNAKLAAKNTNGVIRGTESGLLRMDFLPDRAELESGQIVLTSGLSTQFGGGRFPKDIPIGRVIGTLEGNEQTGLQVVVEPLVGFDQLELVLVITNFEAGKKDDVEILLSGEGGTSAGDVSTLQTADDTAPADDTTPPDGEQ